MDKTANESKTPALVTLEPGTYAWCSCGKSSNQPFCDGTHNGTKFIPVFFKIPQKREAWLCVCKKTKESPFCDGSHRSL